MKITAMGALLGVLLTISFASPTVFACNQERGRFARVTIRGNLVNEDLGLPLTIEAKASGYPKSLIGVGVLNDPACGKSIIAVAGSIHGNTITLSGWIVKGVDTPQLKGTKIKIVADCKSDEIALTFGPISPSDLPLSGFTFVFTGAGSVTVR